MNPKYCCEVEPEDVPDLVAVVRCKDCKHRPTQKKCFPDMVCPCQCSDSYYSWVPPDDWYCADGERKEGDVDG